MIFYLTLFNTGRTTINQKQTPCTNTTERVEDTTCENEASDADNDDDSCDDHNSHMNSDKIITTTTNTP